MIWVPKSRDPRGYSEGEFVPLDIEQFRKALVITLNVFAGVLEPDASFPVGETLEAEGLGTFPIEDTPWKRGVYTAGANFKSGDEVGSFYWRMSVVYFISREAKYAKYYSDHDTSMHIALLAAIARVPGNHRTPKNTLRAAFDAEFRRQLATVDTGAGQAARIDLPTPPSDLARH